MKFQIVICKPPNYVHSECFREVAETLLYGLRRIGMQAELGVNTLRPGAKHILLGAHLLGDKQAAIVPHFSILYNLEQLGEGGAAELPLSYWDLARRSEVWDYSPLNCEEWNRRKIISTIVPIGYVPELVKITPSPGRDIDVLFYGSMNERRQNVLMELHRSGLRVMPMFGEYGAVRDKAISRAKIVLNVHYYDSKVFEIVRVSYLMANCMAVVTEDSPDLPDDLRPGLAVAPYGGLVAACKGILANPGRMEQLERESFKRFSARSEEEILKGVIQ